MNILLTSFSTWIDHQISNSSDDLLQIISERSHKNYHFLRRIPVDFELAPQVTIDKIQSLQPDIIVCCGMAESRQALSIESNGKFQSEILRSQFDLDCLLTGTIATEISHDAGNFVCNYLYYSVLKYLEIHKLNQQCIFVHVPVLTSANLESVVADFLKILANCDRAFSV